MIRLFLLLSAVVTLCVSGCADSLVVDDNSDRGPAGFAPDASSHIPQPPRKTANGNPIL